jgi:hypothetical protein
LKVLYLDESGDHNLVKMDPDNTIFVIGGIIVDRNYARTTLEPTVRAFKEQWFGRNDIILHTADITGATKGFERLRQDRAFRENFMAAMSEMMSTLDYTVVACVIHKDRHVARYGDRARDPYDFGLEVVVERFCFEVGDVEDGGVIYAERRRDDLDLALDIAWERLRVEGTYHLNKHQPGQIDKRIIGLNLKAKSVNIAGLQLADLVISPIGRHFKGLYTHDNWDIVRRKMCRDRFGRVEGYGLVVLPK